MLLGGGTIGKRVGNTERCGDSGTNRERGGENRLWYERLSSALTTIGRVHFLFSLALLLSGCRLCYPLQAT